MAVFGTVVAAVEIEMAVETGIVRIAGSAPEFGVVVITVLVLIGVDLEKL